jgi:DNA mismatch repair protein MutS
MADDSPMRVQYRSLKKDHPNDILFFRLGDFYEMFDEDALEVSGLLNLTLTSRNGQPMCGVPYHAARSYIARLLKAGKKIAVCEQLSVPGPGKGLAERRVVEVITPGTTVDEDYLDKGSSNYLAAVARRKDVLSFAYVEVSTGEFYASSFPVAEAEERLRKELERTHPKELIVQESFLEDRPEAARIIGERSDLVVDRWPDWLFDQERALKRLLAQFSTSSLRGFGLDESAAEVLSAGALLTYLDDTAKSLLPHIRSLKVYAETDFLNLDESTQRNLELVRNLRDGDERFSLLESLDETKTAMGARLLKNRLLRPLVDPRAIGERLDAVEAVYRAQGKLAAIREALSKSLDLERLCSRVAMDRAHGKDLVAIRDSLDAFERVEAVAEGLLPARSDEDSGRLDGAARERLSALRATVAAAMAEDPSILLTEGNLIRDGYDAELDRLKALKENGRDALEAYLQEEREATGISALRIKYNRLIGYFFELSKNHAAAVPGRFIRRQSMADAERFTTDRLAALESELNGAAEKVVELEKRLFLELRETVKSAIPDLVAAARRIAVLDVTQSLARAATVRAWNRPVVDSSRSIRIVEGRHPVVEANLPRGEFVPNDLLLDADGTESVFFALVTGPNMAGKSTYLRQSALIVLLAQIGSFVPAREAEIGVVDKVFCRVGASDNLARGESTFLVEMNETANILRNATDRSLVVMDEVGRGTGTNDGLAIARAVCEELLDSIGCRTLFATHYHELSRITHPRLANRSMEVAERDGGIVFLRRLREGATTESYGIHVAGLAGLPDRVLSRAAAILERLKANEIVLSSALDAKTPAEREGARQARAASPDAEQNPIRKALDSIDLDRTTPLEALELLYRWKSGTPSAPGPLRHRKATPRADSGPELF